MKSEYGDRETIGSQLLNTQEEHDKMRPVQAGELSEEMGKGVMKRIIDYVEELSGRIDQLYIEVTFQRDQIFKYRKFNLKLTSTPHLPLMQPNQDIWFVDYVNQKFEHLWGLPSRSEFDMVLNNPSKDNEKNIQWINEYLKLEKKAKKSKVASKRLPKIRNSQVKAVY